MSPPPEAAELAALQQRFTEHYQHHYPRVLAYARRRTDESTARDVAAETFLAAWRRVDVSLPGGLPWLYRTAANVLRNTERSRTRADRLWRRLASQPPFTAPDPAQVHGDRQVVVEAVRQLPPAEREILALTTWDGLDVATAARVVGCSAGAARARLCRARRRLHERLAAQLAGPSDQAHRDTRGHRLPPSVMAEAIQPSVMPLDAGLMPVPGETRPHAPGEVAS